MWWGERMVCTDRGARMDLAGWVEKLRELLSALEKLMPEGEFLGVPTPEARGMASAFAAEAVAPVDNRSAVGRSDHRRHEHRQIADFQSFGRPDGQCR